MYVDDFKLAGRTSGLSAGWKAISEFIELYPDTSLSHHLGCGQASFTPLSHRMSQSVVTHI